MENKTEENALSQTSEDRSLEDFKQSVLQNMNETSQLGDSVSTISPDSSNVCTEYDDDQFEGIFYKTLKDEACLTVHFVSNAFYLSFQEKLLSDFSSSIECDESRRIYRCTTHLRGLKCHMKLDGNSRNVTVSGVGRIMWRKDYFARIARVIFKQYVQISESQLGRSLTESSQCDVLTAEKVEEENGPPTSTVQVVFSSTPLISRKDSQTVNCENVIQPPVFDSTPIVPRLETQTSGRRLNIQQTEINDNMNTAQGSESQVCGDQKAILTDVPYTQLPAQVNFGDGRVINQPPVYIPGFSQPTTSHYPQINGLPTSQPIYMPGLNQINSGEMYFYGNELNVPQTVLGRSGVTQGEMQYMPLALPRTDREDNVWGPSTCNQQPINANGNFNIQPTFANLRPVGLQNFVMPPMYTTTQMTDNHENNNDLQTAQSMPLVSGNLSANFQSTGQTEEALSTNPQTIPEEEKQSCTSDLTSQTIATIIQRIKGLETQINNVKNSVIATMESRIHEMKLSLISAIDHMAVKTYSEAVQQCPIKIDSSSIDEGYDNQTMDSVIIDTSQTMPKTVFPQNASVDSEHKRRFPRRSPAKGIPVRVTNREVIGDEQTEGNSQPTSNINGLSSVRGSIASKRNTLIIGDSILNPINPKGMKAGVQKHPKSGAKVQDIIDDITLYNMKNFQSVVVFIGGNDSSSGTDIKLFEEKYDELVSLIQTSNPNCHLYICSISPRGDTNVKMYNDCISRVASHWGKHKVTLINESSNFFIGKDGMPTDRYYGNDGIHLSNSGIKRLLHAIESHIHLIDDFDKCIFSPRRTRNAMGSAPERYQHPSGHTGTQAGRWFPAGMQQGHGQNNSKSWYGRRRCFACGMTGHFIRDCWNK